MITRVVGWSLLATALSASACTSADGGSATGGYHACDPLVGDDAPLSLANLLGAGRDADGTLYVVDDGGRDHLRVFVSTGTVLQRFIVAGSGQEGDASLTLSVDDPLLTIRIDGPGPHPTRMGVVRGKVDGKTFDIGAQGDVLQLVGIDALAGLTLKNVPDNVVVEYNASVADGRRFFVTRPKVDWTYEDFRIFFGPADDMRERPLVTASRGNTTYISFLVDGVQFDAVIPAAALGDPTPPTLTATGQAPMTLTLLGTDAARTDLKLLCTN